MPFISFLMSRIGKKIIVLPEQVSVEMQDAEVTVKGPKGTLSSVLPEGISLEIEGDTVQVKRNSEEKQVRSFHGLVRSLLDNMVQGVSKGFEKRLEIHGVGYRAQVNGNKIILNLGFSHPVEMESPQGITIAMDQDQKNQIIIQGIDKQLVGEFAANIRKLREPEPYKGKGIRYLGEYVRRKAGKAASAK